jgi:hypothetical protein
MDNTGDPGAGYGARGTLPGGDAPSARTSEAETPPQHSARLADAINTVYLSVSQTAADFFELVSLELRRAGITFMWMLAWSMFGVLLTVSAWLGLMAGLALWLIAAGWAAAPVVIGLAAANLLGGAAIFYWCMRASGDLAMPAMRRQLRIAAAEVKARVSAS